MGFLDIFRRKKGFSSELDRRRHLEKNGRICDGTILDTETTADGKSEIAYYFYTVHGVDFESSEILTDEQRMKPLNYAPGAKVGVKYDPKNHGNSILV